MLSSFVLVLSALLLLSDRCALGFSIRSRIDRTARWVQHTGARACKIAGVVATSCAFMQPIDPFMGRAFADESDAPAAVIVVPDSTQAPEKLSFGDFLSRLDNEVARVVFNGINPTYASVYMKDNKVYIVDLPAEDPMSPSGPTQVIARVQHTPGVVCEQDISGAMSALKRTKAVSMRPMLSSNPYPKNYAYSPGEYKGQGETKDFLNRYNGKDDLKQPESSGESKPSGGSKASVVDQYL